MRIRPYVGITGPTSSEEVEGIIQEFSQAGYDMGSRHIPMLGYLVSYKTMNGLPTKNRRYPAVEHLRSLLEQTNSRVLAMLHFNSREESTLADQVSRLLDGFYQDHLCRAIQFNIVWPEREQMRLISREFPEMFMVFQASSKAMAGKTPKEIVNGVSQYGETFQYVLIDPSGGRGREFDIDESLRVYNEFRERMPSIIVGFAGGFTGENVEERVERLIAATNTSDFCIDAEGGLRDKRSKAYGDDDLNLQKVRAYVRAAAKVLP